MRYRSHPPCVTITAARPSASPIPRWKKAELRLHQPGLFAPSAIAPARRESAHCSALLTPQACKPLRNENSLSLINGQRRTQRLAIEQRRESEMPVTHGRPYLLPTGDVCCLTFARSTAALDDRRSSPQALTGSLAAQEAGTLRSAQVALEPRRASLSETRPCSTEARVATSAAASPSLTSHSVAPILGSC